ncbi:MAG: tetratricopeptide repeat protein [Gemmatimonadales bacterium]
MDSLRKLVREIHRRSLWQVMAIYLVGAWIGYEVIQALTEGLQLPSWFPALALVLFIIGLPLVLATAFVQESPDQSGQIDPTLLPVETPGGSEAGGATEPSQLRRLLTWRNALQAGVAVFALWGLVAAGWLLLRSAEGPEDRQRELSPTAVAVMPFAFRGNDQFAYLGEGMVDLLSKALDGAGELRSVDPYALLSHMQRQSDDRLDPESGRSLAGRFGAGLFVLGNIIEAGGKIRVDATLYDADGARQVEAEATTPDESGVFQLVDDLARQLTVGAAGETDSRLTEIAAATTTSIDALKAYLEGEHEFRAGGYAPAVDAYRRATAADTSFALAWYRMSLAAEWLGLVDVVFEAADQAVRHSERLQRHDRRLLEASLALRRGDGAEAERRYREIIGAYPEDVEAWYQLGEALFHYNATRGLSLTESRPAFQRVIDLDPNHVFALFHLARIEALEENLAQLDSLVERVRQLQPESERVLELLALRASLMDDTAGLDSVEAGLERAPQIIHNAVVMVATFGRDLETASELAALQTGPTRPRTERALGQTMAALTEVGRGRWRAAAADDAEASSLQPVIGLVSAALKAAAPFSPLADSEIEEVRARLAGLTAVNAVAKPFDFGEAIPTFYRDYLLGLLSLRLGDTAAATRYADRIDEMQGDPEWGSLVDDCAWSLRAWLAWTDGRPADALAALENVRLQAWYGVLQVTPVGAMPEARFLRGQALSALGRGVEALDWFGSLEEYSLFDVVYWGPTYLAEAEIYERLGDREKAALYYERLIDLYAECDPELRPLVQQAERGLGRLTAERGH